MKNKENIEVHTIFLLYGKKIDMHIEPGQTVCFLKHC